jgi:hypothetical protein
MRELLHPDRVSRMARPVRLPPITGPGQRR